MFKNTFKTYCSDLDNKSVHLLLPMIKKEMNTTIRVACTYLKLVHHKIVFRYSPCNTKKSYMHFKNCIKSTRNREFLKSERLAKLTEVGELFHTRNSSSKESTTGTVVAVRFVQFVCMASCTSYTVKLKKVGEINIYQAKNDFIAIY